MLWRIAALHTTGGDTGNGVNIRQYISTGAANQQWDVVPLAATNGGEYSFFSITVAQSGKAADVNNFSYDDGGNVQQWDNLSAPNQQWFLQYVGDGSFYIRNR